MTDIGRKKHRPLVRVMNGLYRSPDGQLRVAKRDWQQKAWTVEYVDWFGTKHERRFATFAAARAFIDEM